MRVTGITSPSELLCLAKSIGRPVPSPTGQLIKRLTPVLQRGARAGTLSATYETGSFPLHTDTAFWPIPCRYVVMRAFGDCRRPTTILSFSDLLQDATPEIHALIDRSVWRVRTQSRGFYCSFRFRGKESSGWRYDQTCMHPVNKAAFVLHDRLLGLPGCSHVETLEWTGDLAIVLDNWKVLHGRGPEPPEERLRILERIYVE